MHKRKQELKKLNAKIFQNENISQNKKKLNLGIILKQQVHNLPLCKLSYFSYLQESRLISHLSSESPV